MANDLALPERDAVRIPTQWTDTANAGFSTAEADLRTLDVHGCGYRSLRLNHTPWD